MNVHLRPAVLVFTLSDVFKAVLSGSGTMINNENCWISVNPRRDAEEECNVCLLNHDQIIYMQKQDLKETKYEAASKHR